MGCFKMNCTSMKTLRLFLLLLLVVKFANSQKLPVDFKAMENWAGVLDPDISNDGKFVLYTIRNIPIGGHTLKVVSTTDRRQYNIEMAGFANFTPDSKKVIFQRNDSLGLLDLDAGTIRFIRSVSIYRLNSGNYQSIIAYHIKETADQVVLVNLSGKYQFSFSNAIDFVFSPDGKNIYLKISVGDSSENKELKMVDVETGKSKVLWSGTDYGNIVFGKVNGQLGFTGSRMHNGELITDIWYYENGRDKAITLTEKNTLLRNKTVTVDHFSSNNTNIFFWTREVQQPLKEPEIGVDVWSSTDNKLQSQQLYETNQPTPLQLSLINLNTRKIIDITEKGEECLSFFSGDFSDDLVVVQKIGEGDVENEWLWNKSSFGSIYLVNSVDGSRRLVNDSVLKLLYCGTYKLSPDNRFLIFYDPMDKNYVSYETSTGFKRNLTKNIKTSWTTALNADIPAAIFEPEGVAGFSDDNRSVFVYDQSDIWLLDLEGKRPALNVTNSTGKQKNMVFRFADYNYSSKKIPSKSKVLLRAFDRINKMDGYYMMIPGALGTSKLTMSPCIFSGSEESDADLFVPLKAKDANVYLVRKMTASKSPNYFMTKDFKLFKEVSSVYPEKLYNWLTTELVSWTDYDGRTVQGILYKPENFDYCKKYPVIIHYYERLSGKLHRYTAPGYCTGDINIPYFVSNGYLVLTPDIYFTIGEPCNRVYNSIGSAADYLSTLAFVDSSKLGIQGHSRGGYETNCLITRTGKFAAACSAAGMSDYISLYGNMRINGRTRHRGFEFGYQRIGASLWEHPDLYIKNSPIFKADKVTTPLLIMHNKGDGDVPFSQSFELFTALRRFGKHVWMLQYDGEDHMILTNHQFAKDFTIRLKQFFDHYLKDSLPPKWMTRGIPAKMKGIDDGLELDHEIKTPGEGLITDEERKKVDALHDRKPITITIE
jgi:dipeptidyl aminopeptidase/acylaminoacyl peptidase